MFHRSSPLVIGILLLLSCTACRHNPGVEKQAALERGNASFAQKKFSEATLEYRKAIQEDMRFGEAHYRLALAYEQLGDRPNALREFGNAANVLPDRKEVQLKAGQYYLFASRFDEARKIAERLLDKNVRNIDAQLLLANALAGLNDLDAAARQVEEAIRLEPSSPAGYSNLAAVELARGNVDKAEAAFKNAITIAPQSIDARIGLASLYWSGNRLPDAERVLTEALAISPGHLLANRTLAALYISTGRPARAETPLKAIAEANPEFVAPRLALADYYLAMNRSDEGLRILESVATQKDGATPARLRLAYYEFSHDKRPDAYARVEKVIASDPKNPQPYLVKAAFLLSENKADEALAPAKAAVAASPRLARAHFAVGTIELARRKLDQARQAFQDALRYSPRFGPAALELAKIDLARGQLESALQFADMSVANLPQSADARYVLVKVLMARGDRERAGAQLAPLRAQFGASPRVQALAGRFALSGGDRDGARKAFEQALKMDPADDEALSGLVSLDLEAGRKAEARQRVETRLAAAAKDPNALAMAGLVYGALNLPAKAEESWRALVSVEPGNLDAYLALGRLYYQQKRMDPAIAEAERLVQQQPGSAGAHTMLGYLLELQGRTREAQQQYLKALEIDPRSAAAANNLAWIYATHGGNLDSALQLAQTAKAGLPESPEVSDTLGWICYEKGLRDVAVGPLEQAVRTAPVKAIYHFHLGMAYLATNDWAKARTSLQQALTLDPNFNGAAQARKALASIQ
jgi:tetratricopeptide (TPR) repeat protein